MRLAIVTGGSRGLGASLCEEYGAHGWEVVEFSRSAPHGFSVRLDASDPLEAARIIGEKLESLAKQSPSEVVAVGNASVLEPVGPVQRAAPADIAAHINTNVTSAILFARAFFSAFQECDCPKTFVNVSSGAAGRGSAGWSLYGASKAAMENFVRAVALEQSEQAHPIRAISVNPGVMDTDMQATVRSSSPSDFPMVERYIRLNAEGQLADPAAIASNVFALVDSRPEPGGVYPVSL